MPQQPEEKPLDFSSDRQLTSRIWDVVNNLAILMIVAAAREAKAEIGRITIEVSTTFAVEEREGRSGLGFACKVNGPDGQRGRLDIFVVSEETSQPAPRGGFLS